jgi:predicted anti-sigma-YlaC factor YlaD
VQAECRDIQERLVEAAGDTAGLRAADHSHLAACAACRAVAEAERGLGRLLERAVPPADPVLVEQVMAAVAPLRVRRLAAAWLPVAASLLLALAGVAMVGGVPGGSLLAQLPVVSSQAWLALANAASDWGVAMAAAAGAARLAMPPAILIVAVVAALIGLVLIVAATRRWQPLARWHRRG